MFLLALGGSVVFGAGLLAAASFSEGTLLATRTAAQVIGWLFVCAILLGVASRTGKGARLAEIGTAAVALSSGVAVLYVAHFHWDEIPAAPIRETVAVVAGWQPDYKLVTAAAEIALPIGKKTQAPVFEPAPKQIVAAAVVAPPVGKDACSSFAGVERLQCRRCGGKTGLSRLFCHESARLEYCQSRADDELGCPSPVPYSPPA